MKKDKAPWYIWFSAPAFLLLWGDTSRRIKVFGKSYDRSVKNATYDRFILWNRAVLVAAKLWGGYFMFATFAVAYISGIIFQYFGLPPGYGAMPALIYMYLMGVYITRKLYFWRKKNIPNLL